ncbi:hypothetical protein D3C75_687750 [compost metagenome]
MDLLQAKSAAEGFRDQEQPLIIRFCQTFTQDAFFQIFSARQAETVYTDFQGTNCFMNGLFEGTTDGHNFSSCFHLCAQLTVRMNELVERPARDFADDIVKCRLEASIGLSSNWIDDFIKCVTKRDFGSHFGNRITGCFRSQSRRAADTWIYFDYIILIALRIQCELHVAATLDIQRTNDFE